MATYYAYYYTYAGIFDRGLHMGSNLKYKNLTNIRPGPMFTWWMIGKVVKGSSLVWNIISILVATAHDLNNCLTMHMHMILAQLHLRT